MMTESIPNDTTQGLAKLDRTPPVITTAEEYRGAMQLWSERKFNVLTPFTNVSGVAPSFGIIASIVKLNADPAVGEVYGGLPWLKGQRGGPTEELAPAKVGLRKLAECGGISTRTERTDGRLIPNYWEFKAYATYRGLDGSLITREATFEWDLRDGSDRLKGWTPNQVTEGRKNGLRNCEARAINAAIRECGCGIKQKYTRAELDRPFVVVRVAFQPDMNDPAIKQEVTRRALEGTAAMYAPQSRALPAATETFDVEPVPREAQPVGRGSTSQAAPQGNAPRERSEAPADLPPSPTAVKIMKVEPKHGETNGRKWTRWTVIDSNGVEYSTFSRTLAEACEQFEKSKAWADVTDEQNGEYRNIVEVGPAQPSLLPNPSDL